MKIGARLLVRRSTSIAVAGTVAAVLAACTGHGGGYLSPDPSQGFPDRASFGFTFSCQRSSGSTNPNPPAGRLRVHLSYTEHGGNPTGSRFTVHGDADDIDPVLESAICIGRNPPPGGDELIILGRYRPTGQPPAGFPSTCPGRETPTTPLCRFEVVVRDDPDHFSIKLSTVTDSRVTEFPAATVFYARAGLVDGGNVVVD
jgi:hypothetical protein